LPLEQNPEQLNVNNVESTEHIVNFVKQYQTFIGLTTVIILAFIFVTGTTLLALQIHKKRNNSNHRSVSLETNTNSDLSPYLLPIPELFTVSEQYQDNYIKTGKLTSDRNEFPFCGNISERPSIFSERSQIWPEQDLSVLPVTVNSWNFEERNSDNSYSFYG